MLTPVLLGCLLGLRHASDPDHVAAIGAIVTRHRRPGTAAWIGAAWGLGHGVTLLAVGAVVVALRGRFSPDLVLAFEGLVAAVLVLLGATNLVQAGRGDATADGPGGSERIPAQLARSCAVGVAHGLAGSAAVALLALAAMPTPAAAVLYLGAFGFGTVAAMTAISLGLGVPFAWAGRVPALRRGLVAGSGALAIGVGLYLAWEIGRAGMAL